MNCGIGHAWDRPRVLSCVAARVLAAVIALGFVAGPAAVTSTVAADEFDLEEATEDKVVVYEPGEKVEPRHLRRTIEAVREEFADAKIRMTYIATLNYNDGSTIWKLDRVESLNKKDQLHGLELRFDGQNHPVLEMRWANGEKHGIERRHSTTWPRFVLSETPWENGKKVGVKKNFDSEGNVTAETPFVDGEPHGKAKTFDARGRVVQVTHYRSGERHGDRIDYWPSTGEPRRVIPYKDGDLHGVIREYYLNGNKKRELPTKDGDFHGVEKVYNGEGELETQRYWVNGEPVSAEQYQAAAG